MFKKIFQVTSILLLAGFSFFYTEKVTKIVRDNDPIMVKINDIKDEIEVSNLDPIIIDDEFIAGISGCSVDVDKSYSKMKSVGEFKEELLVMNEIKSDKTSKNKYIIGGNKKIKNVSIVFILNNSINKELEKFLSTKKIDANFFLTRNYLSKNLNEVRSLSKLHHIYYYGEDGNYKDEYMIYDNNLINVNTNNESNYCLTNEKNSEILKICSDYDMKTIKSNYISDNVIQNVKKNLSNGNIIVFDTVNSNDIKASINYILSKGYNIVSLDDLLNEKENCN